MVDTPHQSPGNDGPEEREGYRIRNSGGEESTLVGEGARLVFVGHVVTASRIGAVTIRLNRYVLLGRLCTGEAVAAAAQ